MANLGRRVAELRAMLKRIEAGDDAPRMHEELKRRLHALGAGSRLLRFVAVADRVAAGEEQLAEANGAALSGEVLASLRRILDELPALAWGQSAVGERAPAARAPLAAGQLAATSAGQLAATSAGQLAATSAGAASSEAAGAAAHGTTWIAGVGNGRALALAPEAADEAAARSLAPSGVSLRAGPPEPSSAPALAVPLTVLVVGAVPLAAALAADGADMSPFEVERTDDMASALDLARAFAPDVVLLDADLPGARGLAETLAADPLTEPIPVVVVGGFARPEEAAPYVALGAARALAKPASPSALRRAAADAAATYVRREIARGPLGDVTLDELGARLAEELRRGLCDAAEPRTRGAHVDLGDGAEVLAALWGAVARIRDLVTIRSQGDVRFSPSGPDGALPLAPWMAEPAPGATEGARTRQHSEIRAKASARGADAPPAFGPQALDAMGIVVADDDPAVTWFLAGVLRAAGATVHEAHDGARALDLAYQTSPDLVVSDVLMPHLDGFALCRALKRDVALRDVPVILLSWKEDLLQRLRELGAQADGYLRKEASAAAFVRRVDEVMRGRRRVAERIAAGGEVRGRLDGMTTRTLLSIVCAHRPDALVSVRDASYLYEVLIQDGRPAAATRTAQDGTFHRGSAVLAPLLGVGSGRFVVAPAPESELSAGPRPGFEGTLSEQLLPAIAAARAAQRLLLGPSLMQIERVVIDLEDMGGASAEATTEPVRSLLQSLARGVSPRALITSGEVASSLVEDVLNDAAARGCVRRVIDREGEELLAPAVAREEETLRGVRRRRAPEAPAAPLPPELGGEPASSMRAELAECADDQVTVVPGSVLPVASVAAEESSDGEALTLLSARDRTVVAPASAGAGAASVGARSGGAPVSARDAGALASAGVGVASVSARDAGSPASAGVGVASVSARDAGSPASAGNGGAPVSARDVEASEGACDVEVSEGARDVGTFVIPRARIPREFGELQGEVIGARATWSTPGEAAAVTTSATPAVPGVAPPPRAREATLPARGAALPAREATLPALEYPPHGKLLTLGSLPPPPVVEAPAPAAPAASAAAASTNAAVASPIAAPPPVPVVEESPSPTPRRVRKPSAYVPTPVSQPAPSDNRMTRWVLFAVAAFIFAVGARLSREHELRSAPPAPPQGPPATEAAAVTPAAAAAAAAAPAATAAAPEAVTASAGASAVPAGETTANPAMPEDLPLSADDKVAEGQGLLEVIAGSNDELFIDGRKVGTGTVKLPLSAKAGVYEIRAKLRDEERVRFALVKAGRLTRLRIAPPWRR